MAPKCKRVPPQYWQRPELWPDIAAAAIWLDWNPEAIVLHLKSTPEGWAKFEWLYQGTVWKMFGKDKKSWSEKTMHAVLSEKNHHTITKPLGCPQMLVSLPSFLSAPNPDLYTVLLPRYHQCFGCPDSHTSTCWGTPQHPSNLRPHAWLH